MALTWLWFLMLTIGMPHPPSEQSITGITWTLKEISPMGKEVFKVGPDLGRPSFVLKNGQLKGTTGCRELSGYYNFDSSSFSFSSLHIDEDSQHCTDAALSLEADLLTILEDVRQIELNAHQLSITGPDSRFVTFIR